MIDDEFDTRFDQAIVNLKAMGVTKVVSKGLIDSGGRSFSLFSVDDPELKTRSLQIFEKNQGVILQELIDTIVKYGEISFLSYGE